MSTNQRRLTLRVRDLLAQRAALKTALVRTVSRADHPTARLTKPAREPRTGRGPYVTMRVGGGLDGVVTLTATAAPHVVLVEATWGDRYPRESISATRIGEGRTPTD
jgi:hypothetical protein